MSISIDRSAWRRRAAMVAACFVALFAGPLQAQEAVPAPAATGWDPWLGCWTLQVDQTRDGLPVDPTDIPLSARRGSGQDIRMCVTREGAGVKLATMVGETQVFSQTIIADGGKHPIDETGCQGWQRATWSGNGLRLLATAELTCKSAAPRTISQLSMHTRNGTWLDIQSVTTGGRESIRVRRYERTGDARGAKTPVGAPLALGELPELSAALSPRVVEAALIETNAAFDLDAKKLIALDDAGVPDSVIDLAVALTYPDKFRIDRRSGAVGSYSGGGWGGIADWSFGDPYLWGYFAPYSYGYWGYGNPWDYPGGGWVIVDPDGGSGGPQPSGTGRVVDGHGYTRVRPREVESAGRAGTGGGDSSPGGSSSGQSGSSGGGVSGQGYSGGSAGSSGGRTAQPRPPGE